MIGALKMSAPFLCSSSLHREARGERSVDSGTESSVAVVRMSSLATDLAKGTACLCMTCGFIQPFSPSRPVCQRCGDTVLESLLEHTVRA